MQKFGMGPSQQGQPFGALTPLLQGMLTGQQLSQIGNLGGNTPQATPQATPQSQNQSTNLLQAMRSALGQPAINAQAAAGFRKALGMPQGQPGSQQPGTGGARQVG